MHLLLLSSKGLRSKKQLNITIKNQCNYVDSYIGNNWYPVSFMIAAGPHPPHPHIHPHLFQIIEESLKQTKRPKMTATIS
jgi:hypothetical protein